MRGWPLLLLLAPLLGAAPPPDRGSVDYRLSPELASGNLAALRVELRFRANADGVTTLDLPDEWAGQKGAWRNVRDVTVEGATSVGAPDPAHRRLTSAPGATLVVRYRVLSGITGEPSQRDEQPFTPWVRPSWFYAMGESLFATVGGREMAPARFDWIGAPAGFAFASDLEHLAGVHRHATRPGTVDDIRRSIVIGGRDLRIIERQDHGTSVRVAVKTADYGFTPDAFADQALAVIGGERRFWGGKAEPFLVTLGPLTSPPGRTRSAAQGMTTPSAWP